MLHGCIGVNTSHAASVPRIVLHVSNVDKAPNAWARLIQELINRPGWTQQRLADAAKVDRSTIRRWKTGESVNVSAQSVQLIAAAAGIDPQLAARAAVGAQEQAQAEDDEAIRIILESDARQDIKEELIAHVRSRRRESEDSLVRDVQVMLRARTANS